MKGEKISQMLKTKGLNFPLLAEACGVTTAHVYNVAYRKTTSLVIAQKIACAIDAPFQQVFPEYAEKAQKRVERAQKISRLSQKLSSAV
ncbi:MAG: hypothetical protein Q4A06_02580 [Cardiobacteriaceae bacterium]|nr:hypothetical protein [Cardiobacteriaceae bacterium]